MNEQPLARRLLSRKFILTIIGIAVVTFFIDVPDKEKLLYLAAILGTYNIGNGLGKGK